MTTNRRGSTRVHTGDDGSGRIALIGLLVVLALIVAAVKLTAQETASASHTVPELLHARVTSNR